MSSATHAISIIIPAHNEALFLPSCLESIFSQRLSIPFEVIVVDNNSTDDTAQVARKWNVELLSEKKKGVTCARNSGAKRAKADILYFLDADCRLPEGRLQDILNEFQKDTSLSLISGPYIYDKDGFIPYFFTKVLGYFTLYHSIFKWITGITQFSGGNIIIRKKVFEQVGKFDEHIQDINIPEDVDLAMRLRAMGGVTVLFEKKYAVYSSFRRVKQSPLDSVIRFRALLERIRSGT